MKEMLFAIYRYRGFIIDSVKRDFQSRYQESFLGATWLILQPLAMIAVYTLIFSEIMRAKLSGMDGPFAYSIYLCSGVLAWGMFTEMLTNLVNVFLANANILKKLSFPRICLPIIITLTATINFLIIFTIFVIFLIFINKFPGLIFFEMFPVLLIQMIFTLGVGVILGVMNVFARDVGQFIGILLQFWFWLTPIVYVTDIIPQWATNILEYNPMAVIIRSYQNIFLYQMSPDWMGLLPVTLIAIVLFLFSWRLFKNHSADIVDEI